MFKIHRQKTKTLAPLCAVAVNLLLLYAAYMVTRLAFFFENAHTYAHVPGSGRLWTLFWGGVYFDTSAIAYTNALYLLLVFLPLHAKEGPTWQKLCKWVFVVVNAVALAMNLCDSVYFQYTARRTTTAFFSEFGRDDKLGSIVLLEFVNHWYLVVLFVLLVAFLWRGYRVPRLGPSAAEGASSSLRRYYAVQTLSLLLVAFLCWAGMRGGFWDNRPIKVSTANQFIVRPNDASLVLNTPFSVIRTIGKASYHVPSYFSAEELERIYSPIHNVKTTTKSQGQTQGPPPVPPRGEALSDSARSGRQTARVVPPRGDRRGAKNIVVIFLESFGREYFGSLNKEVLPGYRGYTQFLDSLIEHSVTFRYTCANGWASIDAMPSALSGLPMMVESFVASSYALNHLQGTAQFLGDMGYQTAFFHGAPATSLGFQGFTKSTGFQQCWAQEDYEADRRTRGKADSDNWWGIWDEPFLQYFRMKMSDMKQPFMTALFTLTSHHPFHVPDAYKERFPEEELPIHKCIRYTDHALRRFFDEAKKEPWFENTLFVLTGDHPNMSNHAEYRGGVNHFSTSIIFYDPSGALQPGIRDGIAQQSDIMPTILGYVGCDKPYMAFGIDLFNTPPEDTWAVNYLDGVFQYCKGDYLLQFDGEHTIGFYRLTDYLLRHNLMGRAPQQPQMERELKAIIQQYMQRMVDNRLTP